MAITCYEKTTEAIANDETKLKDCIYANVDESRCATDNWLKASIEYGSSSAWKLTPTYISVLVLDKVWEYYKFTKSKPDPYPRVVLLKPPAWKKTFSSVRARDQHGSVLWELHDKHNAPTEDVYAALVPGGCTVEFLHVDVRYLGPKEASAHEDEPTAGLSKAKGGPEESGSDPTRQSGVLERASGEEMPRQRGVMDRDSDENRPRQPGVVVRHTDSKQLARETYPFLRTYQVSKLDMKDKRSS